MSRIALAILTLTLATRAGADLPPREPSFAYERGAYYYDHGDFEAALLWFAEASELTHAPPLLFNLALTHYQLGNCSLARTFYRRFLARAVEAGLLARYWWRMATPATERNLRFEKRLVDCIYANAVDRRVLGDLVGVNRWDWGGGAVAPVRGLW